MYRVARLFKDDQDLMKGFYHFLPDRNVQQRMAAKLDELEDMPRGDDRYSRRKGDGSAMASTSRGVVVASGFACALYSITCGEEGVEALYEHGMSTEQGRYAFNDAGCIDAAR